MVSAFTKFGKQLEVYYDLNAALDKAIELVPRLYDAIRQAPDDAQSVDPFQEVARFFAPEPTAQQPT